MKRKLGAAWREAYDNAIAHGASMSEAIHAANAPILVPCEGSGRPYAGGVICSMCGETPGLDEAGNAVAHERLDILAMLDRGDFG